MRTHPRPTPFPYTTLFRSRAILGNDIARVRRDHPGLRAIPDGDGPPVLFVSLTEFVYQLKLEGMLAKALQLDRKSTRLNSSHRTISYAVFCLKKKKNDVA